VSETQQVAVKNIFLSSDLSRNPVQACELGCFRLYEFEAQFLRSFR
jgi:hypothetical protein